jgi:hypothetical protein
MAPNEALHARISAVGVIQTPEITGEEPVLIRLQELVVPECVSVEDILLHRDNGKGGGQILEEFWF